MLQGSLVRLVGAGALLCAGLIGCTPASEETPRDGGSGTGGAAAANDAGGSGSGGQAIGTGGSGTGGAPAGSGGSGTGGAPAGSGGAAAGSGGSGTGGAASGSGGAAAGTGGRGTGGAGPGTGGATVAGTGGSAGGGGQTGIVNLFNGTDLTGWTAFREPTTMLTAAQAQTIFKVENGSIRVYGDLAQGSTQARHTLVTARNNYRNYKLWMEYRWGTKTFAPYVTNPRDAGLLFHVHRLPTQVWPPSIEFQIKENETGDIWSIWAKCSAPATSNGTGDTFVEGGTLKVIDGSTRYTQHKKAGMWESLTDWNMLELQVTGDSAVYLVNGHIVNRVSRIQNISNVSISQGAIALQAEHAEAFYRNVRIQELP